jgi:hypothetical protein
VGATSAPGERLARPFIQVFAHALAALLVGTDQAFARHDVAPAGSAHLVLDLRLQIAISSLPCTLAHAVMPPSRSPICWWVTCQQGAARRAWSQFA